MKDLDKDFLLDDEDTEASEMLHIDFKKYWTVLKSKWKTLMWWTVGGFALGCIIALASPRKYVTYSKLAPELSSTAMTRLSSMASMMGFTSTMMGTTDAVYPMVYPDLVHSPEFIADLFDTPVTCTYRGERKDTTLYGYMTEFAGGNIVAKVVGYPMSFVGKIKDAFEPEEADSEPGVVVPVDPFHFTRKQQRVYKTLCKKIEAEIDRKTMVVTIEVTMPDPQVSGILARAVNDNIRKYVTSYRTAKAVVERDYYEELSHQVKAEYYQAQRAYSSYVDAHQNMVLQSVMIERERLHNESNLKFQLYNSVMQQLQNARAKVQQETPVFAEVMTPTIPLKPSGSRKKKALAFAFLGLCAGAVYVLVKNRKKEE